MSWTWWMTVLVILAVLVLIGCIPVGVDAAYGEGSVLLSAKIGFFRLRILPAKPKKPKKPKKAKKSKQQKPAASPAPSAAPDALAEPAAKKKLALPGGLDGILRLANLALSTLGDLRRKLRVEELTLHVTFAGDDPADAALHYGQAWAAVGALMPALDRLFVIKKRDICPILDYNREQMSVDAHLILTITTGRALALGLKAGLGFLKLLNDSKKGGANT